MPRWRRCLATRGDLRPSVDDAAVVPGVMVVTVMVPAEIIAVLLAYAPRPRETRMLPRRNAMSAPTMIFVETERPGGRSGVGI